VRLAETEQTVEEAPEIETSNKAGERGRDRRLEGQLRL
jgi:hypothetical protein